MMFTAPSVITLKCISDYGIPLLCLKFFNSPPLAIGQPPNTLNKASQYFLPWPLLTQSFLLLVFPTLSFYPLSSHFSVAILNNLSFPESYALSYSTETPLDWCILL